MWYPNSWNIVNVAELVGAHDIYDSIWYTNTSCQVHLDILINFVYLKDFIRSGFTRFAGNSKGLAELGEIYVFF